MKSTVLSLVGLLVLAGGAVFAESIFPEPGALPSISGPEGLPALFALLLIVLWRGVPFPVWRRLHRNLPVAYLLLTVYASMLAPSVLLAPNEFWADPDFWSQPEGLLFSVFMILSSLASLVSFSALLACLPGGRAAMTTSSREAEPAQTDELGIRRLLSSGVRRRSRMAYALTE